MSSSGTLCLLSFLSFVAIASSNCGVPVLNCIARKAVCVDGFCECRAPKYVWGRGDFMCYRKNQVAAEVKNDPTLTTFNNESTQFPYPCRYLLGHVRQKLKDKNRRTIGYCEFQIHGFNRKNKGKIYVYGFDAALRMNYLGRSQSLSLRRYGTGQTGITSEGTQGLFLPNGPWSNELVNFEDEANGIYVRNYFNPINFQVVFEADQCGLRVTFVPYDETLQHNAPNVPGISVAVNCAHGPVWLSKYITVGLPPVFQGGQLFADIQYPGLTIAQSMVARAFESGIQQNQPSEAFQCTNGQQKMQACNDNTRAEAMTACFWMLTEPRFIKCLDSDNSADMILFLFNSCVEAFCDVQATPNACFNVIDIINALGCGNVGRIPILAGFVSGELCPP